jgi:hypothetical protein
LFGGARFRKWGEDGFFSGSPYGTYRTLCVRTCDGYYFPISFSTTPSRFMSDAQSCQAICPGTNVALYTHRNPGEESESMVSLAGEPYTALPTAFRYRTEFDPACICGSVTAPATILNDDPQAGPLVVDLTVRPPAADGVPIPRKRPLATEDPETLANRAGELVPRPVVTARTEAVIQIDPSGRSIRVVGPSYYYGQQASAGE